MMHKGGMMIDLRSDTLTVPDDGMRQAMASASVGDDVYSEDPTVLELQDRVASMFGKEAALFVPSGTQGNQICIALHATTGEEVIAERNAHIFHYENAATSVIARAQIHALDSDNGAMVLGRGNGSHPSVGLLLPPHRSHRRGEHPQSSRRNCPINELPPQPPPSRKSIWIARAL
ncbi:MAG: hypothetical protein IPP80_09780 [Ignavibacteria bacterium]|nr:hypothetical protein [Ignavibacteria bacterium]